MSSRNQLVREPFLSSGQGATLQTSQKPRAAAPAWTTFALPGYSGSITASSQTPFFAGSCEAISGSLREDVQSERRRERLAASTKTEDEELVLSVRLLEERKRRMET